MVGKQMDTSESSNPSNDPLDDELAPPADPSTPAVDDIPTAKRESVHPREQRSVSWALVIGGLGAIAIGGLAIWGFQAITASNSAADLSTNSGTAETNTDADTSLNPDANTPAGTPDPSATAETVLGHKAYEEAPQSELVPVRNGDILLREAAAEKLEQMIADASADGISLVVVSGFRTFEDQRYLFFDVKAERGQTSQDRAEVSAPPGYSEHHTGYAVDLADGYYPDTDLQIDFEGTPAFRWLEDNAAYYGFELSFPRDNEQGISYEPWHWRFVGDPESLETFYKETVPAPPSGASPSAPSPNASPESQSSPSKDGDTRQDSDAERDTGRTQNNQTDDDRAGQGTNQALVHFGDRTSR